MIHRGEIVEQAVRQSGIAISEIARRMNRSRRHLYNLFENPNIPVETVVQISKIIHYDILQDIPKLKKMEGNEVVEEPVVNYEPEQTVEYWKNKYLNLLEKYNELLEKR